MLITRRTVLAAAGTLAATLPLRKPARAATLMGADALVPTHPPQALPPLSFTGADGTKHTLADWKGQGVVLNLWATWCMPCVAEMPALAGLAAKLVASKADIAVLPVSSDHGGAATVRAFFNSHHITDLPVLVDPDSALPHALHVNGIPTTFIIGRDGREHARAQGPVDWTAEAVINRIQALVGPVAT